MVLDAVSGFPFQTADAEPENRGSTDRNSSELLNVGSSSQEPVAHL